MNNKIKIILMGTIITLSMYLALVRCSEKAVELPPPVTEQIADPTLKSAAINYYVATNGSDNNPGTFASPFKTIQKAANVVNPGDTVIVRNGTYTTTGTYLVYMTRSGTEGNYITFRSEHKWGAVIDGQEAGDGSSGGGYGIMFGSGASYVQFVDFEIKNFLHGGFWGNDNTHPSSYITIQGNKIHDIGRYSTADPYGICGIFIGPCTGAGHNHWNITRNLIYNIGRTGGLAFFNKDHALYTGSFSSPAVGANYINFTYNIVYAVSGNALELYSDHDLIANNVMAWSSEGISGGSGFIQIVDGLANETIANNIFYQPASNNTWAILNYINVSTCNVKNNMCYDCSLWYYHNTDNTTAMKGNNYGRTDCEHAQVDPKFISALKANAPNVDFNLQSGSPAINAGTSVGLTTDYLKNVIIATPDIGAVEYIQGQAQITPPSTVYYNTQISATTTKNDCGTGYTGSTVTYTVPAEKYSSTISQADADSKAAADLSANKQAYANANGTCTAVQTTVYYSTQVSATATKNDCGTGYTGSTVTYTVPAKKYSSAISQADADQQAVKDVNANKQAFANNNGTCTTVTTTIYYNTRQFGVATKSDCGSGYTGSTVTYTVPAGTYSSAISQADADNMAIADVNANKQSYANTEGTCTRNRFLDKNI